MRASRQPFHQPLTALGPAEFCLNGFWILLPIFPESHINRSHTTWTRGSTATGLVWRNQNLHSTQCIDPYILSEVTVITDQDTRAGSIREFKNRVLIPTTNVFINKSMQLTVTYRASIGHRHHVTVKEPSILPSLNKPCPHGHVMLFCQCQ